MAESTVCYFDKIYSANDQTINEEKKPLTKSALKRRFYAAYDNAESQKLDLQGAIGELRQNFDNLNITALIEASAKIKGCIMAQDVIKSEFLNMFGTELNTARD